ncbi:unnamed protein product [Porites lobata]|uniref:Uncharacterized protein n=1 Tax=Porites lobata TaxID=104759 RepID=A0ABN8NLA6_9CNID|nr:unnamed protein product [Porites lobata]
MSQREEKLWKGFLQGIRDDNEDQVKRILLETGNPNLGGGKSNFLTRKITTTQGTLTVLHLAVKNGAESIIKLLFKNGVNVNATSEPHKFTALHMAVEQDKNGIIQLLLSQRDVDVNACDEYGHTPLKLAAEKGNQQTVKWLIEKEADITKADSVDNTAIHVAADKGHYGVLQLLLSSVAFAKNPGIIGKQNKDKNTPLHLAVARECQNSVALLLCYGAVSSLELENRHNETPKQLAKGNKVIMELLENPLKARQHLMELTRPVVKEIGRGGSVEANSDRYPVTEQIVSQPTSTSVATVLSQPTPGFQPTIMYVTAPQVTAKNEYHTKVGNGGYAAIGPQSALHVEQSAMTTGVQAHLSFSGESSYSINMSGGLASIGDHSVTNVGTATPRTPGSEKLITEDHFELPKRTQFYAHMGKSFKMSGKGGSVEHDGDKDPVTELKPQDSHDTGLPGATSDIEEDSKW